MWKRYALAVFCLLVMAFGCACGNDVEIADSADERVADGYREAMNAFNGKDPLVGFWEASVAYACYGDEIYGTEVDLSGEHENHRGTVILALIMTGQNPYDYEGRDLVQEVLDIGTEGAFAVPVMNFLALQAAGADLDGETENAFVDYCCEQLNTLSMGPDIGGWAAVALQRYIDSPAYGDRIAAAIDNFVSLVGEDLSAGSMGSGGITYGCVVMGLTAFTRSGIDGMDPTTDSPWVEQDPLTVMHDNLINGEENVSDYYKTQYYLEFTDLYHVLYDDMDMAWIRCGVHEERLESLMAEAENYAGDEAVDAALAAAKTIPAEELSVPAPKWGKIYYDLFDAVKAAAE